MESVYFPQRPLGLIGFIQTLGEEIRMKRICAVFLALVFFLTTLPAMAQNPASPRKVIPFNELASSSSLAPRNCVPYWTINPARRASRSSIVT